MKPLPEEIRTLFDYDCLTGTLTRRYEPQGPVMGRGVRVCGKYYATASICWVRHYGSWPKVLVDHKDRNRDNNKITNLREATTQQNAYNVTKFNPNGAQGITYDPTRKKCWRAQIRINGIKKNLGRYLTKEEAAAAYRKAALENHGEFACVEY